MTIPTEVIEQAEKVRKSSVVNMMDRNGVQVAANDQGSYALVTWMADNPSFHDYSLLLEELGNMVAGS